MAALSRDLISLKKIAVLKQSSCGADCARTTTPSQSMRLETVFVPERPGSNKWTFNFVIGARYLLTWQKAPEQLMFLVWVTMSKSPLDILTGTACSRRACRRRSSPIGCGDDTFTPWGSRQMFRVGPGARLWPGQQQLRIRRRQLWL